MIILLYTQHFKFAIKQVIYHIESQVQVYTDRQKIISHQASQQQFP